MKACHIVPSTPGACGMYSTVHELVLAERAIGIDACIIDPRLTDHQLKQKAKEGPPKIDVTCPKCEHKFQLQQKATLRTDMVRPPAWSDDRGVCIAPIEYAAKCDVIVSHSGLDMRFNEYNQPRIHVAHGRPNSSYRIERDGEHPIYGVYRQMADDPRWRYIVTLWPGFEDYWKLVFPRVKVINSFVDLNRWTPGPNTYKFGGKRGEINVVIADMWRKDMDPFYVIHAFAKFVEKHPEARLHIYGMDGNERGREVLLNALKERGVLGETKNVIQDLRPIYRAADMVITPHKIATRVVREALACGTPVVAGAGNPYTPYSADPENLPGFAETMRICLEDKRARPGAVAAECRQTAEFEFSPAKAATAFKDLFEEILA